MYPGLLITRSLGDTVASNIGVIYTPEIRQHTLQKDNKFIIIGSDGLWEYISNEEAARMVYPYYSRYEVEEAAIALVKEAQCRWAKHETLIDDVTCVIIFLV